MGSFRISKNSIRVGTSNEAKFVPLSKDTATAFCDKCYERVMGKLSTGRSINQDEYGNKVYDFNANYRVKYLTEIKNTKDLQRRARKQWERHQNAQQSRKLLIC